MIKAGIIGATGYAGQMLNWILLKHPSAEVVFLNAHSNAGVKYEEIYNNYIGFSDFTTVSLAEAEEMLSEINVLFISLPHGKSFEIAQKAVGLGVKVIDLGADYRLKDVEEYESWYGVKHENKPLLDEAVYGLVELNRQFIRDARIVGNPGCYPTASILALAPLLSEGLIDTKSIIIDAKSGVSGAGRNASVQNLFCEVNESVKAYGIGSHRHTPEIEQMLNSIAGEEFNISFTPHLIPMNRGILATCYAGVKKPVTQQDIDSLFKDFYCDSSFVKYINIPPETRNVKGTNLCHIYAKLDSRTGRIVVVSAIDNLIKGAAGQAVQCMNLMFGLQEDTGLNLVAVVP
ncbi:MAG: N-acetyl-gamma-glutamyl-phosphate reductase [Bacillota bacterium]|nr:N-acetyl-gamma-glutamyl-phosphate reductase [Bacillota bacterium]